MKFFLKILLTSFLVFAFFLLVLPYISPRFRGLLNNTITPVLPGFGKMFYSQSSLVEENDKLRQELEAFKAKENYWDSLYEENEKLRGLMNLEPQTPIKSLAARVIIRNPLTGKYRFVIDKGTNSGLRVGMPVMVGQNLIGRIVETEKTHSVVGTLAMKNISVFCRIQGTEFHGKLDGEASITDNTRLFCVLTWLPRDAPIEPGMVVLSAGFSSETDQQQQTIGLIPAHLSVGKVISTSKNEKFQDAIVELQAPWVGFDLVTVIMKDETAP